MINSDRLNKSKESMSVTMEVNVDTPMWIYVVDQCIYRTIIVSMQMANGRH